MVSLLELDGRPASGSSHSGLKLSLSSLCSEVCFRIEKIFFFDIFMKVCVVLKLEATNMTSSDNKYGCDW